MMFKISAGLTAILAVVGWLYIGALQDLGAAEQANNQLRQDLEQQAEDLRQAQKDREAAEALLAENRQVREVVRVEVSRLRAQLREDRRHASEEYQACVEVDAPSATIERLHSLADATHASGD